MSLLIERLFHMKDEGQQIKMNTERALEAEARPVFRKLLHDGVISDRTLADLEMHWQHFPEKKITETELLKAIIADHIMRAAHIDPDSLTASTLFNHFKDPK